jgi:hypothetical protein
MHLMHQDQVMAKESYTKRLSLEQQQMLTKVKTMD